MIKTITGTQEAECPYCKMVNTDKQHCRHNKETTVTRNDSGNVVVKFVVEFDSNSWNRNRSEDE